MQDKKKTDKIIQYAGIVAIAVGIIIAILSGRHVIEIGEKIPDYLFIIGIVIYFWGRQSRIKHELEEQDLGDGQVAAEVESTVADTDEVESDVESTDSEELGVEEETK